MPVTQFNMKWVEQAGLVKFDFLGLKTLTVLERAVELIRRRGIAIDLAALPLDDKPTYAMLSRGETVGVFQVEGQGMRRALVGMKPDRLGGPDRAGRALPARSDGQHPDLQRAQARGGAAGLSASAARADPEGDLRRHHLSGAGDADRAGALGLFARRRPISCAAPWARRSRRRWTRSASASSTARWSAASSVRRPTAIFDLLRRSSPSYGFNKSHAAAYALVSYQTAYLKANHPGRIPRRVDDASTWATPTSSNEFRLEARRLGIEVVPPDVNRSGVGFEVADGRILYALAALKGVGAQAVEHLVAVRGARPFADLADFAARIDPRYVGQRTLECLAQAGAFDSLEPNRAQGASTMSAASSPPRRSGPSAAPAASPISSAAATPRRRFLAEVEPWPRPNACSASSPPSAPISARTRSTNICRLSKGAAG